MATHLTRPPADVTLNELSAEVFSVLAGFTVFPWPVLKTQAARMDADPANLTVAQLQALIDGLAKGVSRFTSPQNGADVRSKLESLVKTWPG